MIRCARVSSTLIVAAAALAGCADGHIYNGGAKLQPVMYIDKTNTQVKGDLADAATQYVRSTSELTDPDDDWKPRASYKTGTSSHVRLDQMHDGVPVWGADIVVHTDGGTFNFVAGNRVPNLAGFDVSATIGKDDALATAKADYDHKITVPRTQAKYSREKTTLVIYPQRGGEAHLAWHVVFFTEKQGGVAPGLWNYFVDAKDGRILDTFNAVDHVFAQASGPGGNAKVSRTWTDALDVKASGSAYVMDTSRLQTYDMHHGTDTGTLVTGPLDNIGDAALNDAHGFAEITLNTLKDWEGFNSIDNQGFQIKSRVHYDMDYENAFWDGTQMTYGDGKDTFYPLSGSVDVVAHEINHGFTSFHSNLTYSSQSGGMNEAFSDIAGTVAEFYFKGNNADFDMGRDIFKGDSALRFMCDPTADGISIDNFANYSESLDVHYTSGIGNKSFCMAARRLGTGGTGGTATVESVKRASEAYYHANAAFWTASTTFKQACQGVMDAARDLNFTTAEKDALLKAWLDVGVYCDGQVEPLVCDETITSEHGEVKSPNFPSEYPTGYKHTYCIIPASGQAATLHFTNFDVESGYDFVTLRDGDGEEGTPTSGTTAPADFTAKKIAIKFTSDDVVNRPGWRATW